MLIVDHDLRLIMRLCDRVHVLAEGKTIAEGTPTEVQRDPAVLAAYIGEPMSGEVAEAADHHHYKGGDMRRKILVLLAAAAVAGLAAIVAQGAAQKRSATLELQIGAAMALSGPWAVFDEPLLNGIKMAAKQIDAKGGIDGVTVKLTYKDFQGDNTQQLADTQQMMDNGIKVFIASNGGSLGANQLIVNKGGLILAGSGTDPENTQRVGPHEFTVVFTDNQQASAGAIYACSKGYRKAWVLGSPDSTYTGNMGTYFQEAFAHYCHGKVVGKDVYKIGQTDFGSQATKIQNANPKPDVIFSAIFVPDSGVFLKALRSAGVTTPVHLDRRQRLAAIRDLRRPGGLRRGIYDPRVPAPGQSDGEVQGRLHEDHGQGSRDEHDRGDRPRQRVRARLRGREGPLD